MLTLHKSDGERFDVQVIDMDVHIQDEPDHWAPYCDMPWRMAIEHREEVMGGLSLGPRLDPMFPGGIARRDVFTPQQMRQELDALGVDIGVLFPNYLLTLSMLPHREFAAAIARAYNAWLLDVWLSEDFGLKGALALAPQDPGDAVRQIERYGRERNVVAGFLPCAGLRPYYGDRWYDPIYEAAQSMGLPLILHSVSVMHPVFPFNLNEFDTAAARHALAHPISILANMVSMITAGVPERFPRLKIAFSESGISWVPFIMWRLDKEYIQHRGEMPMLRDRPSTYIKQFYFCTQPIEEPTNPQHLINVMDLFDGQNSVMFASDWPHPDFDHPRAITRLPLSPGAMRNIMSGNAARFLGLDLEMR